MIGCAGRTAAVEFAPVGGNFAGDGRSGFDFTRVGAADTKKNEMNYRAAEPRGFKRATAELSPLFHLDF